MTYSYLIDIVHGLIEFYWLQHLYQEQKGIFNKSPDVNYKCNCPSKNQFSSYLWFIYQLHYIHKIIAH